MMSLITALVQSALEVLMAHHSKRRTLLQNLQSLQLLASPERERQFRIVDAMLRQLEQNAEVRTLGKTLNALIYGVLFHFLFLFLHY